MPELGFVGKTARGFEIIRFSDHNDAPCSLQASSLAIYRTPGTSAVWLGVEDAAPKVLASQAASVGVETAETNGWVPFPIPEEVLLITRMHLDREQVDQLVTALTNWLERDSFENEQ